MASDPEIIEYNGKGGALIVEFRVGLLIADWYLKRVDGTASWLIKDGRTDDNIADVAPIDLSQVTPHSSFPWGVLLYGPQQDEDYEVRLLVMQDGQLLKTVTAPKNPPGKLPAKTAKQESGSLKFVKKAGT